MGSGGVVQFHGAALSTEWQMSDYFRIDSRELDRYITGNYGEDQFAHQDDNEGERMADEERALSIPTPGGALVPQWWADVYGPRTLYHTTLDVSKPDQRALLLRSINEDCETAKDWLNREMEIVGYTVSPAAREVDGELQQWVRCVLHLADGTNVTAGSMGLLKSIMLIEQLGSKAPWNPPLRKVLKARDLKNGRQWYYLSDTGNRAAAKDTTESARKERYGK